MTTPERLRRRQRREEVLLIVLGVLVGLVSIYFHQQDVKQRTCLTSNITELTSALTARGQIADKESTANKAESAATRQLIIDVFAAKDKDAALVAFNKAKQGWADVDEQRAQISKDRADHPIPAFPQGTCD